MDDELKRLRRFVLVLSAIVLFLLLGITAWGSVELSRLKSVIAGIEIPQPINGIDGKDGYTPVKGIDYIDGVDSISTHTETVTIKETAIPGSQGEKGEKGDKGDTGERGLPGRTILIRLNPITLLDECRFLGDIDWQPLEECGVE